MEEQSVESQNLFFKSDILSGNRTNRKILNKVKS